MGAVIEYWLRPNALRAPIHRIEVEHGLYLAAARQEQIKDALVEMYSAQTESLSDVALQVAQLGSGLGDLLMQGFNETISGLHTVDTGIRQGFDTVHRDLSQIHGTLEDVLQVLAYPGRYQAIQAAKAKEANDAYRLRAAAEEFAAILAFIREALNEPGIERGKAMLDEAIARLRNARTHPTIEPARNFQLAYLCQQHLKDFAQARNYYLESQLNAPADHIFLVDRHLAHLDYIEQKFDLALERMEKRIRRDEQLRDFLHHLDLTSRCGSDYGQCFAAIDSFRNQHQGLWDQSGHCMAIGEPTLTRLNTPAVWENPRRPPSGSITASNPIPIETAKASSLRPWQMRI
jgi:choline dehydrogenase-like flavoprotein